MTGWPYSEQSYIVAVSGGPDSVSLLHSIKTICDEGAITMKDRILVAHFEHGLRGQASIEDACFVEDLAKSWGFNFSLGHGKPEMGLSASSETWAREARHHFFASLRSDGYEDAWLVLGHHQDDLVETLLINLSRGSGLNGLTAMPAVDQKGKIVRPLMSLRREDVITYCSDNQLSYCNDLSNQESDTWRNALRINIIPRLESLFGEGLSRRIAQTHDILSRENHFLEKEMVKTFGRHVIQIASDDGTVLYFYLNSDDFIRLDPALRRRICHHLLSRSINDKSQVTYDTVLRLEAVIMSEQDQSSEFIGGLRGVKQSNYFRLFNKENVASYQGLLKLPFYPTGSTVAKWRSIYVLASQTEQPVHLMTLSNFHLLDGEGGLPLELEKKYNTAYMITSNERFKQIEIRTRRTGDQLHFINARQSFHKSLKKYLQEQAVWSELRDKVLLFAEGETIHWIPGIINLMHESSQVEQAELTRICFMC